MKRAILFIILSGAGLARADAVRYVTDQTEVTLRTGTSTRHEIVRLIPSGTQLTVLDADPQSGYTRVRTPSGAEGWLLTRYLMDTPPARIKLAAAEKKLAQQKNTGQELRSKLAAVNTQKDTIERERDQLREQNGELNQQLAEIRRVSSNAVNIATENRNLKGQITETNRENQLLRQENESLKDRSKRDWFIVGAIVVVSSMLFGILLTRIRWHKKSSWGEL